MKQLKYSTISVPVITTNIQEQLMNAGIVNPIDEVQHKRFTYFLSIGLITKLMKRHSFGAPKKDDTFSFSKWRISVRSKNEY